MIGELVMPDSKEMLSPAEWKSVTKYLIELSQRMEKATAPAEHVSTSSNGNGDKSPRAE